MQKDARGLLLVLALLTVFFLCIYGIGWGLPSRWCTDEPVAGALRMIAEKSVVPQSDPFHPTFHYFVLIIFFLPLLSFLKIVGYPLLAVKQAASVSWIHLSNTDPMFSTLVYITARLSSAIFAVLTVYMAYRIAKISFSKRAGIFTALFLSVTMGFVSEAHTAKSTSLLISVVLATVFSCIHYFEKNTVKRYVVPFILGGLALATKYNGGIVIFPLCYLLIKVSKRDLKYIPLAGASFLGGFFIGFPGAIYNFSSYLNAMGFYKAYYLPQSRDSIVHLCLSGIVGYILLLKDIFGVALFLLVVCGIVFSLFKKNYSSPVKLIMLTVVPSFAFACLSPVTFEMKYIILIVPFLLILSSSIADGIFKLKGIFKKYAFVSIFLIWLLSLAYTWACDNIYAYGDVRYNASAWVKNNVDQRQKIVIIGDPGWVIHNELFKDYDITFLLNDAKDAFNTGDNIRFVKGRQYSLSEEEEGDLVEELNTSHAYYVIFPVFSHPDRISFWKTREKIRNYGVEIKYQNVIKEFARKTTFFWRPNLGGHEPQKIVISYGVKK
ncbi:MAG: glycosyltransferase family 39 protein [Candidatus Omnitrophota bacterium]